MDNKNCDNCAYQYVMGDDYPCINCSTRSDYEDRWEPQTIEQKARKPKPKDLRDYFAAKAMQAIMANEGYAPKGELNKIAKGLAKTVYTFADAMIEARLQLEEEACTH